MYGFEMKWFLKMILFTVYFKDCEDIDYDVTNTIMLYLNSE